MRVKWDLIVMLLSIFNSIMAPIEISFRPPETNLESYIAANAIIDGLFALDIIINFRTTFQNVQTGDEVTNSKQIARQYIKGVFWIDFLSVVPFDRMLADVVSN